MHTTSYPVQAMKGSTKPSCVSEEPYMAVFILGFNHRWIRKDDAKEVPEKILISELTYVCTSVVWCWAQAGWQRALMIRPLMVLWLGVDCHPLDSSLSACQMRSRQWLVRESSYSYQVDECPIHCIDLRAGLCISSYDNLVSTSKMAPCMVVSQKYNPRGVRLVQNQVWWGELRLRSGRY